MSKTRNLNKTDKSVTRLELDIWGARGSRSVTPPTSAIANYTSCYSVKLGEDVFVFDGGRGLGILSRALEEDPRFRDAKSIQLLLSHAHMDHWEGLKDANWFWRRLGFNTLWVWAPEETQRTVKSGYAHPSYVPLEILAIQKIDDLQFHDLEAGDEREIRGWNLKCFPLNHYSGIGDSKQHLSALGFRLTSPGGAVTSYLCDHEPTEQTVELEDELLNGAHLAIVDAHFANRCDQAFGHGSIEHAASLARTYSDTVVLSAHHGPMMSDQALRESFEEFGGGLSNFALAIEGERWTYDSDSGRFSKSAPSREVAKR